MSIARLVATGHLAARAHLVLPLSVLIKICRNLALRRFTTPHLTPNFILSSFVNPDVSGLTELRWPSGSVIILVMTLSDGWWNVRSNHKEQLLTTELEVLFI
jgi:hypothetical protein